MIPLFCVLLRVLRVILFSRGVNVTLGSGRTQLCGASEPRTPSSYSSRRERNRKRTGSP